MKKRKAKIIAAELKVKADSEKVKEKLIELKEKINNVEFQKQEIQEQIFKLKSSLRNVPVEIDRMMKTAEAQIANGNTKRAQNTLKKVSEIVKNPTNFM